MGGFYVNFTVRGPSQKQVAGYLKYARRSAYISPTVNGITMVFDEKTDLGFKSVTEAADATDLERLAEELSKALSTQVLAALGYDGDVLMYWLFERGQLIDDYNSHPGWDEGVVRDPEGGDAKVLCMAFAVRDKVTEVHKILHEKKYAHSELRHLDLAKQLGVPERYADHGFKSIEVNAIHLEEGALLRVG